MRGSSPEPQHAPRLGPRFGFTITKKIGNAVVRNKIRRRLRAALIEIAPSAAHAETDYVLVARKPAVDQDFRSLVADLRAAFQRVHAQPKPKIKSDTPKPAVNNPPVKPHDPKV